MNITIIESTEPEQDYKIEDVIKQKQIQISKRKEVWGSTKMEEQVVRWLEELVSLREEK